MAQIKLAEYTFDNSVGDCLPTLRLNSIEMTTEDIVSGVVTRRTVYIDDTTLPYQLYFQNQTALLTVDYLHIGNNITNLASLFSGCTKLKTVNTTNWDLSSCTNISFMFQNCSSLTKLDLRNWVTSSATTMQGMFHSCTSLTEIKGIENFNVSSVTNFGAMFYNCKSLLKLDLRNWVTSASSIYTMQDMFSSCESLEVLRVDNFDTSKLEHSLSLNSMFQNCKKLKTLNLNSFTNPGKLGNAGRFFEGCSSLEYISMNNFIFGNCISMGYIFKGCTNLKILDLTQLDTTTMTHSNLDLMIPDIVSGVTCPIYYNSNTCNHTAITSLPNAIDVKGRLMAVYDFSNSVTSTDVYPVLTGSTVTKTIDTQGSESYITHRVIGVDVMPTEIKFGGVINGLLNVDYLAVTNSTTNLGSLFENCQRLETINTFGWDTSNVTLMNRMFTGCSQLTEIDMSGFNTSKTTNIYNMFSDCSKLIEVDLSSFNTENTTTMQGMFWQCANLQSVNVSSFNTEKCTHFAYMFWGCTSLLELDLTSFNTAKTILGESVFVGMTSNQIVYVNDNNWTLDESPATVVRLRNKLLARYTFDNSIGDCLPTINNISTSDYITSDIVNGNITTRILSTNSETLPTRWQFKDIKNLTEVEFLEMSNVQNASELFSGCSALTKVNVTDWNTNKMTNFYYGFLGCAKLTEIIGIEDLDVSNCTDLSCLFESTGLTSLNLSKWNVAKATKINQMFYRCSSLTSVNLSNWNTSNVTTIQNLFNGCGNLSEVIGLETWNTENITNMGNLFNTCYKILSIDMLENWSTKSLTNMVGMFNAANGITSYDPIKNWDTSKVTTMQSLFAFTRVTSFSFENWDTSKVQNMNYMLAGLPLDGWDLSNLNTSSVTNMANMFEGCTATTLDLSHFITDKVTTMQYMFVRLNAQELKNIENWNTSKVTNMSGTFNSMTGITELNLSGWDTSSVTSSSYILGSGGLKTIYYDPLLWSIGTTTLNANVNWIADIRRNNGYWLDMSGITSATTITLLNTNNLPTSDILTDWGDGTRNSELTHTYSTAGQYVIATNLQKDHGMSSKLTPYLTKAVIYYYEHPQMLFYNCQKLTEVTLTDNWVKTVNEKGSSNMWRFLYDCTTLTKINYPQNEKIKASSLNYAFHNCRELESIDITWIDDSILTDMSFAFSYGSKLTEIVGIENINTSKVTSIESAFQYCSKLKTLDLLSWNTSSCTNMAGLFRQCISLTDVSFIDKWDLSKVTTLNALCHGCDGLTSITLANKNLSSLTNFNYTFAGCDNLTTLRLVNSTIPKGVNTSSMFENDYALKTVDFSGTIIRPISTSLAFAKCSSLESLDLSSWDVSQCTNMANMFNGCTSLTTLNVSNWNTSKVTTMNSTFYNCPKLVNLNLLSWDTSNVGNMEVMFHNCQGGMTLDLSSFNTQKVTAMNGMFQSCIFSSLDLSNFVIGETTTTNNMFYNCKVPAIGLLYSPVSTINKISSLLPSITKPTTIYYYDADPSQLTPVEGVTFKKYAMPTTIQLPPHIQLHSLPDGTRDEVDIKTGILTRNVVEKIFDGSEDEVWTYSNINNNYCRIYIGNQAGVKPVENSISNILCCNNFTPVSHNYAIKYHSNGTFIFQNNYEGTVNQGVQVQLLKADYGINDLNDWLTYLQSNPLTIVCGTTTPTTEQLILNYNNSCDYGRILPTGMCDKYDVVNSMYTQTMTSILLDGENTWDAMEEMTNVVKFTATGTTVGVEELNMLGAGGLYCDNDLFPNINDDSDVEHCRVDEAGNKFYIYISKDRLMSPDLIGYQIWLQANPFNLIYELAEHITYSKPYEELDATQARWEGMDCMRDGAIKYHTNSSDNITMYPTLEYVAPSINNFEVPMLEPNTEYTVYAEGINTNDTINLGGNDINFNNGTVYTSGDNQWLRIDNNDSFYNMVITKGDTTGEVVPYFEGMTSVENPKVQCGESTVSYTDLKLRSLPNGVKDTINVVTGEYVQRVGEVTFDGSEDEGWARWYAVNNVENNYFYYIEPTYLSHYTKLIPDGLLCNTIKPTIENVWKDYEKIFINGQKLYISLPITKAKGVEEFKQWLSNNPTTIQYELAEPVTTKLDPQTLLAYTDGTINLSSDTGLLPTTHYTVPSTNTFHLPSMKTGTRYTLKYPSASGSITIGDITYSISSNSMLFTTPLKINGDTSAIIFSDANPENVVLIEGAYNTREVPYFTGVKSVKNPNIVTIDQLSTESNTYSCATDIELRGLPNGVADSLDIVRGKLTRVVGVRDYQEGDENLANVWTDGYETVYALSSPVVTNVQIETPYVTTHGLIELSSEDLIPQLNYRAQSSNNFPLDLLQPNSTYTLYADTLIDGTYTLGGTHTGTFTGTRTITLGDVTDNLLTFNGDLGLSNVMLIKGNSLKTTLPKYFSGLKSVTGASFLIEGMAGETNELTMDEDIVLRDCNGVKDVIDLTTGTLTKRTGEIVLNGRESWVQSEHDLYAIGEDYCLFQLTLAGIESSQGKPLVSDKFIHYYMYTQLPNSTEAIYSIRNILFICVKKTTIGGDTISALQSWLNQNPTTVIYTLTTPLEIPLENVWTLMPPTSYSNQTEITTTVPSESLKPMLSVTIATTTLEEIVSQLESRNAQLEEENLATMMALTEVYEMFTSPVATMSLDSGVSTDSTQQLSGMTVSPMGLVYANLIRKGFKTIEDVPYFLQAEVSYILGVE